MVRRADLSSTRSGNALPRVPLVQGETWTVRPMNSVDGYSHGQSANRKRLSLCLHASEMPIAFSNLGFFERILEGITVKNPNTRNIRLNKLTCQQLSMLYFEPQSRAAHPKT